MAQQNLPTVSPVVEREITAEAPDPVGASESSSTQTMSGFPGHDPPTRADSTVDLQQEKLSAEVRKLKAELVELQEKHRWPWLLRTVLPALLITFGSGLTGFMFGDSIEMRSRTEMRRATMDRYFSVDNSIPGKRKQMLEFIERYLAKDDPEMLGWVRVESAKVDEQLVRYREQIATMEADIKALEKELREPASIKSHVVPPLREVPDTTAPTMDPSSRLEKLQRLKEETWHLSVKLDNSDPWR